VKTSCLSTVGEVAAVEVTPRVFDKQ